jgi:ABC-type phosphate transport system substrate-binding protein
LRRAVLAVAAVAALAAGALTVASAEARFRIIVNPQVKGSQIPRTSLSSIFLGRVPRWSDGSEVHPVDQSLRSTLRVAFSNDVHQQGLMEIQVYWQREIARGRVPPPVKSSDDAVVEYVASTPGAIGYVSTGTSLPGNVREVAVID